MAKRQEGIAMIHTHVYQERATPIYVRNIGILYDKSVIKQRLAVNIRNLRTL